MLGGTFTRCCPRDPRLPLGNACESPACPGRRCPRLPSRCVHGTWRLPGPIGTLPPGLWVLVGCSWLSSLRPQGLKCQGPHSQCEPPNRLCHGHDPRQGTPAGADQLDSTHTGIAGHGGLVKHRSKLLATWLALTLVLAMTGCRWGPNEPPSSVREAGDAAGEYAKALDGVAGVKVIFNQPGHDPKDHPRSADDVSTWLVSIRLRVSKGTGTNVAVAAAQALAENVAGQRLGFAWEVGISDADEATGAGAEAGVYSSQGPAPITAQYFAVAREIGALPGVERAMMDHDGVAEVTTTGFQFLKPVGAYLAAKQLNVGALLVSQGRAHITTAGKALGAGLTELVTQLGTQFAARSVDVDTRVLYGQPQRRLTLTVEDSSQSQPILEYLRSTPLAYTPGEAVVTDFFIAEKGTGLTLVSGKLNYAGPQPPPPPIDEPSGPPTYSPPSYIPAPPCTVAQLTASMKGRVEAALGHRAMTILLTNTSATRCSVEGYPGVKFFADDGAPIPVTLTHGSSYMFSDPGPAPISLAPGATATAMLAWGANSTTQGHILPASMAVAPREGEGFVPTQVLTDTPDIIEGSELEVSAWDWPDAPLFR
ncbi:hypothetical protein CVS27_09150 [Arthrobacter glacialis]|uniref:DUF4232 domain-containing protein n=1 Tax=Arthrobacter glacialis TaxID=1664 RepID=A0A2S3ZWE3_ARTGL|nr:hypothetical protein CVS27_09150 [Arthrobacter glacialis]